MQALPLSLTARAPAKLILSGEHSVLYDQPALAVAVQRYTSCTVSLHDDASAVAAVDFKLNDLNYAQSLSFATLHNLRAQLQANYQQFLQGQRVIKSVLSKPFELLQYAVANFLHTINMRATRGFEISMNSNIPVGCGMGSSAAAVIASLYAMARSLQVDWRTADYVEFAKPIENLQHGRSSGVDLQLVSQGGCLWYEDTNLQTRAIPTLPLYMVNTGTPQSSTGECVAKVAQLMDAPLAAQFGAVTRAVDQALASNDLGRLQTALQRNHQLLCQLQVVPAKIQAFIRELEAAGLAAKICGAGAVLGESAGIVLTAGEISTAVQAVLDKYKYNVELVTVDQYGTKLN